MKRFKTTGSVAWIICLFLIACTSDANSQETRKASGFSKISFSISGNLYITQSDEFSLKLEGSDSDLAKVVTKVEGSSLIIKTKNNRDHFSNDVKVYVSLPALEAVDLAGSGDVIASKKIEASALKISLSGSGDIIFNELSSNSLYVSLAGSGDVDIKGTASDKVKVSIAGSGDVDVSDCKTQNAKIDISGSGSVKVWSTEKLETNIVGSGSVRYKGNPLIDANTVGSGSTRTL